eukprot:CAMPEP_0119268660 /NCGR_PEP_ID=MMETSP1329-20130426/6375_1 /TAXON_ID=114041 /ORGANISM="Genus nov. species nov., Strain RCC1024" /LENGTH=59 /DNA_ID=CAMNT_0007268639 /DNA_START=61 /DNA_END=236 /DNA_ORIENTATION=+
MSALAQEANAEPDSNPTAPASPAADEGAARCPARLIRCERVLRQRTRSVLLVLDRVGDP